MRGWSGARNAQYQIEAFEKPGRNIETAEGSSTGWRRAQYREHQASSQVAASIFTGGRWVVHW